MYGTFGGINQSSKTSVNRTRDLSRALSFGKINDAKEGTRRLDQLFAKNQDAFGIKGPKSAGALKAELGDDAFKKLTQAIGRESGKGTTFASKFRFSDTEQTRVRSLVDEARGKAEKATTKVGGTDNIEKSVQKGAEKGSRKGR